MGVVAVKQPNRLVKGVVLLNFFVLVGGCVSYQAGAFNWLKRPGAQPTEPPASPVGDANLPEHGTAPAQTLLPGSKSFRPSNFIDGATPAGPLVPNVDVRTDPTAPAQTPTATQTVPPVMIGGSKAPFRPVIAPPMPEPSPAPPSNKQPA